MDQLDALADVGLAVFLLLTAAIVLWMMRGSGAGPALLLAVPPVAPAHASWNHACPGAR